MAPFLHTRFLTAYLLALLLLSCNLLECCLAAGGAAVRYQNVSGWQPPGSVIEWERGVLEAWSEVPDCRSDTGLCSNCGAGAIVVERLELGEEHDADADAETSSSSRSVYEEWGLLSYRAYSIGMDGEPPPWDYLVDTFEIASYTKVVTAFAMQVMINEGALDPNATVRTYLPQCDWEAALSEDVQTITLEELRLQLSGLPAQPPNRAETGSPGDNPFGGYTVEMLCDSLLRLPGLPTRGRFSYSNYGYGMLGYFLTLADNFDDPPSYEELVRAKVLLPLGMNATSVTFDEELGGVAVGCNRGLRRGSPTMRRGQYGVLQGNGALRSNLRDMAKFFGAMFLIGQYRNSSWTLPPVVPHGREQDLPSPGVIDSFLEIFDAGGAYEACTCVSEWCEGWLCPQPNPVKESIGTGGATTYTSGLLGGFRKSGDTDGYSVRGAYSWQKRRAVFAVDTCGGCGSNYGTSGSAVQRLALLLADGPPNHTTSPPASPSPHPAAERVLRFEGVASSHAFPSNTHLHVEVREPGIDGAKATVLVASSDGQGCTSNALPIDGGWELERSALYGCGWDADDPLAHVEQSRKLLLLPDGAGAVLQEMGADIYLQPQREDARDCRTGRIAEAIKSLLLNSIPLGQIS